MTEPLPLRRRRLLQGALAAPLLPALLPGLARPALAQGAWPSRTVRVIVPFTPGGSNDAVARPLAEHFQRRLGQPFVVENRPGAGSTLGSAEVARSPADGYTLLVTSSTFATSAATQRTPYDATGDFEGVALCATAPLLVLANKDFPASTLAEAAAYIRANPGKVDYGSAGPGSINQLSAELFAQRAGGLQLVHIPYRGMGPATTDLVAGTIQLLFTTVPSAAGLVRENAVKVLGWTSEARPESGPAAPTPKESGLDYSAEIWWGLLARRGTPPEILRRLNEAANEALGEGRLAQYLRSEGATPATRPPGEFDAFLRQDVARWRQVAETAQIRID
ncbi:tripartite tricarboxylate transporter substrate binding protein [Pseudoroseomonas cervicalis]|uniref:Bug family tripartite tricarboxylate transporter substrate binding protein n=1 Tax=Teichococcus cervicalis TaxID=204525 RepID=UPI00277F1BE6|nr:tripartite tricarboxylate transporter substrate binding protein [Pseudoroseomonas cervicalis]MDQ1081804.1 tripartite-type tricarboxylate transporter receptor subunit TctC [Pseudoroseomonas cervicalis]